MSNYSPLFMWIMMTSSNENIFRVTGPLCGEFTGPGELPTQRPVTRSFDVFFHLRLNKRLSKQPWGWWFEMPSWSLWRQCNVLLLFIHATEWNRVREWYSRMIFTGEYQLYAKLCVKKKQRIWHHNTSASRLRDFIGQPMRFFGDVTMLD